MDQSSHPSFLLAATCPAARTALLIDGDNLGAVHAQELLAHWRQALLAIRRVYADQTRKSGWSATPGLTQIHSGTGKNATDMLIAMDAAELALSGRIDALALATSDRDFTPMAHWLRERGIAVMGFGEQKAPDALRAACTSFFLLRNSAPAKASAPPGAARIPTDDLAARVASVLRADRANAGLTLQALNTRLASEGVTLAQTGAANWRAALSRWSELFVLDPKGPAARVRLRQDAPLSN